MSDGGDSRTAPATPGLLMTTSSGSDFQLPLAGLQKNTLGSVLLGIKQMPCIVQIS